MFTRRFAVLCLVIVVALAGFGVNRAQAQEKTFVIGLSSNADSLDPSRGFTQEEGIVNKAAYDTLVTFPADNVDKIVPNLATSWDISKDGLTYTFHLKDGVSFSSGNPMTSADVLFTFNRTKNVKGNPSFLTETFDSVSAPDKSTVVLKLKGPDPAVLAKLVFPAFGVQDSETVKKNGGTDADTADKDDKAEAWLNNNSAGTGPYILTKWDKGNEIDLVKNPKYWGTAPAFDKVVIKDIPKAATQKTALEAGDIDLAFDITPDQSASIKSNSDLKLYEGPSPIVFFLLMNMDKTIGGPMSDPKVQQAVRLALDYEGIKKLTGGPAVTPASVIPAGFFAALGPDKALKRDVDAAKKLMKDAGFESGFTVDMEYWDTTYQGVNFGATAQKVQADLKDIGITVNLKGGEISVVLANYRDGKEALGMWFWGPDYIDPLDYVQFLPEGIVGKRAHWTDASGDKAIKDLRDQLNVEVDPAKRVDLFGKMQTWLQSNGPFAPFLQPGVQIAYRASLKGFAYSPQWQFDPATFSK